MVINIPRRYTFEYQTHNNQATYFYLQRNSNQNEYIKNSTTRFPGMNLKYCGQYGRVLGSLLSNCVVKLFATSLYTESWIYIPQLCQKKYHYINTWNIHPSGVQHQDSNGSVKSEWRLMTRQHKYILLCMWGVLGRPTRLGSQTTCTKVSQNNNNNSTIG